MLNQLHPALSGEKYYQRYDSHKYSNQSKLIVPKLCNVQTVAKLRFQLARNCGVGQRTETNVVHDSASKLIYYYLVFPAQRLVMLEARTNHITTIASGDGGRHAFHDQPLGPVSVYQRSVLHPPSHPDALLPQNPMD